jgi:hypothetical protein
MTLDSINAAFEAVFCVLIWHNVLTLLRDRRVQGVSLLVQAFACVYSGWACVYYASIGHWLSLAGQVVMLAGNLSWMGLALRFRTR